MDFSVAIKNIGFDLLMLGLSIILITQFLGKTPRQITSIHCTLFPSLTDKMLFLKHEKNGHEMSRLVGKPTMWFPNRSDTNRAIQGQKQARSLKFQI